MQADHNHKVFMLTTLAFLVAFIAFAISFGVKAIRHRKSQGKGFMSLRWRISAGFAVLGVIVAGGLLAYSYYTSYHHVIPNQDVFLWLCSIPRSSLWP